MLLTLSLLLLFLLLLLFFTVTHGLTVARSYDEMNANHSLDLRAGRKALESSLRSLEAHRFREAMQNVRAGSYEIKGFYHTSVWRSEWRSVLSEQLGLLDGKREQISDIFDRENRKSPDDEIKWGKKQDWPSLLKASSHGLHVTVAGEKDDLDLVTAHIDSLNLANRDKLHIQFNRTINRGEFHQTKDAEKRRAILSDQELSEGEASTFIALHDYCVRNPQSLVYYLHLKGACCTRKTEPLGARHVTTWREAMNAFVLEFPSICLRALLQGYDSCGMESQGGTYSGNFWWANCQHVRRLPPLVNRFDAYAVEYAIFNVFHGDAGKNEEYSYRCGYSTFNCNVDHYVQECPRLKYIHKLLESVVSYDLPLNFRGYGSPFEPTRRGELYYNVSVRKFEDKKKSTLDACVRGRSLPS
jgi:hypothetical protein